MNKRGEGGIGFIEALVLLLWGEEMNRYIDEDTLKANINTAFLSEIGKIIDSAPSIDIVRCKECKKAHLTYDGDCKYCEEWKDDDGNYIEVYHDGDHFCSYGESEGE